MRDSSTFLAGALPIRSDPTGSGDSRVGAAVVGAETAKLPAAATAATKDESGISVEAAGCYRTKDQKAAGTRLPLQSVRNYQTLNFSYETMALK